MVLVLTLLPSDKLPPTPEWKLLSFDTFSHICVFGLLTFLTIRSFYRHYGKFYFLKYAIGISLVLCLLFGVLIEMLQTVMKSGRHGEISDVIGDFIGELFGALFFYILARRQRA